MKEKITVQNTSEILIISGRGDFGGVDIYHGKRTEKALKLRLTRERCQGDRWAKAILYTHKTETGHAGIDFESGEMQNYPWAPGSWN